MKRCRTLFLALFAFVLNFLSFWYADVLFNRFFVLGILPVIVSLSFFLVTAVCSVAGVIRGRARWQSFVALVICIITVIALIQFPFRRARVKTEMILFEKDRMEVVEQIADGRLTPDAYRNVRLPWGYRKVSSDGTVYVYQNDEEQVACFWVFRGMLSGSTMLIYSPGGEALIRANEDAHAIASIEQLKEHWYLVETDY